MSIKKVDFGRIDAEAEQNLGDYFVDTGVLAKLINGSKYLVIGRKGSGKTALFRLATKEKLGRDIISLDFENYPWEAHKMIREGGLSAESAFVASWRFMFFIAICRHWMDHAPKGIRAKVTPLMRRIYRDEEPGFFEALIDKSKRVRRIQGPSVIGVGTTGGIEFEAEKSGPVLADALSQWCQVLESLVLESFDQAPFTIVIDRLDDGWDASDNSKNLLAGVLKAARALNAKLARASKPAAVIVFLRSDIFNELRFNDKNKMSADIEQLEWPDDRLLEVACTRIARSLGGKPSTAWNKVFSTDEMQRRALSSNYIVKRTMGRPRDMIAFCIKCKEAADGDVVQTGEIYAAENQYSRHIYDELDDEMHKQLPNNRDLLQSLKTIGKTRFKLDEWIAARKTANPETADAEARAQLKILFDYSIVGVPRKGGAQRGTRFQFNYNDRLVEPDFGADITVHPALKKELQLIEPRRNKDDGADDEDDE